MQMYFIAIVLPEKLNRDVLIYKKMMLDRFHSRVGLKSPAHITIVPPFWLEEEKEPSLRGDLDFISNQFSPFPIATANFSAFPPRTIFIDVVLSEQLVNVKNKANNFFTDEPYQLKADKRPFHPHITIATRDLTRKAFHEAWPLLEKKKFLEQWTADSLSLLRHNEKNWEVVHTSPFP